MTVVYLLGAGFSRATSDQMPLMNELSERIANHLQDRDFGAVQLVEKFSGDFEAWMTYLSAEEPWLNDSENLRNHAAFHEVTTAVSTVIEDAQNRALDKSMPPWLTPLVHHWKHTFATVVTFNYDEIVEAAVEEALRTADEPRNTNVYPLPLTPSHTRLPPQGLYAGVNMDLVFNLLKLHGSVNWFYSGLEAPTSDPVYRKATGSGWRARDNNPTGTSSPDLLVDKSPLIVPPTAVKTAFYGNKILRSAWSLAADAIRDAHELHVLGYSAPESDLLVRALIATTFRGDRIVSVDRSGSAGARVKKYLPEHGPVELVWERSLEDYVAHQVPPISIRCVNYEPESHRTVSLLDLSRSSERCVSRGACPICTNVCLQPSGPGEISCFSCDCCKSTWRGTGSYHYVRGHATEAVGYASNP